MGRVLGFIPAKGGSTRLRRKNVAMLDGKTLLERAVECAFDSGVVDRIVVSTEDQQIAEAARQCGADVPFLRPEHLARDPAGVVDVALHLLQGLREQGDEYHTLIILLPTSPLRTAADVHGAYNYFVNNNGQFLMSVSAFEHTPFAALRITQTGLLEPFFPEHIGKKSQEMPTAYRPNGAIHVLDIASFERERSYYAQPLLAYEMPIERSVDIDNATDLLYAEALIRARKG